MPLKIRNSRGLQGEIRVPGDKSITHRAIILGAIAEGVTTVRAYLASDDCLRTITAFRQMGIQIETQGGLARIEGKGLRGLSKPKDILDLGNSGTSLRLLCGLLAGQDFSSMVTGDASLCKRPMLRVVKPLRMMGAQIEGQDGGNHAPLSITGRPLKGISYSLPIASAQVKTAILLAGIQARGDTTVIENQPSRDHTERMLRLFGVRLEINKGEISIQSPERLNACEIEVPGDISSAAFFVVAALILPESNLVIRDVGVNPTRTGFIEILKQMGGSVTLRNLRETKGESVADIEVRSSLLKGIVINPEDVPSAIDEFPILSVAASCAEGRTVISGAKELRMKESDRIRTMAEELRRLGVSLEEHPDGLSIQGSGGLRGARCKSHGDHRVAMSLAIAGLVASGETLISESESIETSFPNFESLLNSVRIPGGESVRDKGLIITIDGPAGSGKSSSAKALAKKLHYLYVDTGALYRAIGFKALKERLDLEDPGSIEQMLPSMDFEVRPEENSIHVWVDGEDVTKKIRSLSVGKAAAAVSKIPAVRKYLLAFQREAGASGNVIMEGRDIGTVIFPSADVKFFLDASSRERGLRRFLELKDEGSDVDYSKTQQEIDARDQSDSGREISPLKKAEDAICIDSTQLTLEEVVEQMLNVIGKKL